MIGAVLVGLDAFLLTGAALVVGTTQLDRGRSTGSSTPPLRPTPLAAPLAVRADRQIEHRNLTAPGAERLIPGHLVSPQHGSDTAVVLVAGAGPSSRTQRLGDAEAQARRGLHAVTYDKARDGYSRRQRDFAALAEDLKAVVAQTRVRTGARRVGVVATSAGGWVAARAAAGRGLLPYLEEDARPGLAASTLPILALWCAEDEIVPVGAAAGRLTAAGRPVTIRVFPGTGHKPDPRPGWLDHVAPWATAPPLLPGGDVARVEPATAYGVPGLPGGAWSPRPLLHLFGATLAAITTAAAFRRRPITEESTNVRS